MIYFKELKPKDKNNFIQGVFVSLDIYDVESEKDNINIYEEFINNNLNPKDFIFLANNLCYTPNLIWSGKKLSFYLKEEKVNFDFQPYDYFYDIFIDEYLDDEWYKFDESNKIVRCNDKGKLV